MHSTHLLVSNKVESIFLFHSLGCRALKNNLQKRWKLDLPALELRIKLLSWWKHCLPKPACHVDLWYLISGLTWEHINGFEDDVWGGGYQQHISGFVWALLPKHQVNKKIQHYIWHVSPDFLQLYRDRRDLKILCITGTFVGSKSIPRLIPILEIDLNRDWFWCQERNWHPSIDTQTSRYRDKTPKNTDSMVLPLYWPFRCNTDIPVCLWTLSAQAFFLELFLQAPTRLQTIIHIHDDTYLFAQLLCLV